MWRTSLTSFATTVGIFGLSTLALFLFSFRGQGQQPVNNPGVANPATVQESIPLAQRNTTPSGGEISPPLSIDQPPPIGVDLSRDPIFQELKKAFLSKDNIDPKPIVGPFSDSKGGMVPEAADAISDPTWQAIEHLMAAARILQAEEVRLMESKDSEGLERNKRSIRTIRDTVRSLLK